MRILETRITKGPNLWSSINKHLIVLKIDLEDLTELSKIQAENLEKASIRHVLPMPSGIFSEKRTDKEIMDMVKYLALKLQISAGMNCEFASVKATKNKSLYYLAFDYIVEQAGIFAGEAAVRIINAIVNNKPHEIEDDIKELIRIKANHSTGPTTAYLLDEIKRREIPYRQFENGSLMTLGYGCRQKKIRTAVADTTSGLGIEMAGDKEETKKILEEAHIPVPKGILVDSETELRQRIGEVRFPFVTKPLDGNHGRGVTTDINTLESAIFGYNIAKQISDSVIVEEFIKGDDFRFLVINYKLVAVAKRTPAFVTGNGKSSIEELIEEENRSPDRGKGEECVLAQIKIDKITTRILSEKKLSLSSILKEGEILHLKDTANISAGGIATDVTDQVHPDNKFMAEHIARLFNLDICGIDIMATDISVPITREIGAIIEVNAGPGLRMHSNPQVGLPRNVAAPIIDMLFPDSDKARIPVVAVTGSSGKTTTVGLIANLAKHAGYKPGYANSEGIFIQDHMTYQGNCTGYMSAQDVLFDPLIDFAVLECSEGGIRKSGLGFDYCNVSIITNINEEQTGSKAIESLEDLIKLKSVVLKSTFKNGYAILNADDDSIYNLKRELDCKIALFSTRADNERIKKHCQNNDNLAVIIEDDHFVVCRGSSKTSIVRVSDIPTTLSGKAECMVKNILPAILTAVIYGFRQQDIVEGLKSFVPAPALVHEV